MTALREALREAEWGDWWNDLPGGSIWMAAAAAAISSDVQPGGDGGRSGGANTGDAGAIVRGGGCARGGGAQPDSDSDGGGGDGGANTVAEGRQAADGGCDSCGWRIKMGGKAWGERPGPEGPHEDAWRRWRAAWEQAVLELRRRGLSVGAREETAMCMEAEPVRTRLWQSWTCRRRRRVRSSIEETGAAAELTRRRMARTRIQSVVLGWCGAGVVGCVRYPPSLY